MITYLNIQNDLFAIIRAQFITIRSVGLIDDMEVSNSFNESEIRKASLLSQLKQSEKNEETKTDPPADKFYLVVFVFFFLGFGGMVPASFFLTATDYWMYKFRDVNHQDHYDATNKTYLQANFASISNIIHSIPTMVTTILVSLVGHKLNVRFRLISTLSMLTLSFIVFTIFVVVDTDSWQMGFFILTMTVTAVNSVAVILLGITNFAIMAKFPAKYLKIHLYGTTTGGIFSSVLQILCLSGGKDSIQVGLMYYLCGTSILIITVLLAYLSDYSPLFKFYMGDTVADTRRPLPTLSDMLELSKRMWPYLVPMIWSLPTSAWGSSSILILIVSEYYGHGNIWADKYFTPVITFLLPNVVGLFARVWAKPWMTAENAKWFVLFSFVKTFTMNPLFMFCNALPRHHLPVLLSHDWEYILLHAVNAIIVDFLGTVHYLSTKNLARDKTEEAFIFIQMIELVLKSVASPLSAVWINEVL